MKKRLLAIILLVLAYYVLVGFIFFREKPTSDFPLLEKRLGTILFNTKYDIANKAPGIYCYYPGNGANPDFESGEKYILKRAGTIYDCNGWYGTAQIYKDMNHI